MGPLYQGLCPDPITVAVGARSRRRSYGLSFQQPLLRSVHAAPKRERREYRVSSEMHSATGASSRYINIGSEHIVVVGSTFPYSV